jgi:hypothetical protein
MAPWGVTEAAGLGLLEILRGAGGIHCPAIDQIRRDRRTGSGGGIRPRSTRGSSDRDGSALRGAPSHVRSTLHGRSRGRHDGTARDQKYFRCRR